MNIEIEETKKDFKELIPQVVERIFHTCRNDPSFHLKDEIEVVENRIQALKKKLEKQNYFFNESEKLRKDITRRIELLDNENNSKQIELLEELGSEL